jgi:hypothetical protein
MAAMISKETILAGDGHFHLYPCHEPATVIRNLIDNLNRMTGEPGRDIFRIAFLAESGQHDYFHKILKNGISFGSAGLEISPGPEARCVFFGRQGKQELCLVAGRQIVTNERLEMIGIGMEEIVPDGLPAEEVIERITGAGGLPVLPFSPGKWFFKRGKIASALAERYRENIIIGDSSLRPRGWPEPEIMRRAGGKILPGSDLLPLPGDDKYAGCYGFIYRGSFDPARPLTSMREIIAANPQAILPAGRRCPLINVAVRLFYLKKLQ